MKHALEAEATTAPCNKPVIHTTEGDSAAHRFGDVSHADRPSVSGGRDAVIQAEVRLG